MDQAQTNSLDDLCDVTTRFIIESSDSILSKRKQTGGNDITFGLVKIFILFKQYEI